MKLNKTEFTDKVYACWIGKNIGGTMGTPYEGRREMQDIQGFVTKPGEVLPNDDLDLQLVWLNAVERTGAYGLDCKRLGEFWCSYIVPYWNEYGIGKVNMQRGLLPPLSGDYNNNWKHSNGAWIRTEIWASLAPGAPDVAAHYAVEDAKVDHGAGEGTLAAAFVAAMQSMAFVIPSLRECLDTALALLPETCRVASTVRCAIDCYEKKMSLADARNTIQKLNDDIGDGWFEAPSNIGYTVLGLLYGEGDFKKSMIYAINCGDDTDCTGATVGATLGILNGTAGIPADWRSYLGDDIITISLNRASGLSVPRTCRELTDRVVKQTPHVLAANAVDMTLTDGNSELPTAGELVQKSRLREELARLTPYSFSFDFEYCTVTAIWDGAPDIQPGESKSVTLHFRNRAYVYGNSPYNLSLRWLLPDGFAVYGATALFLPHYNAHNNGEVSAVYTITAGETVAPLNRVVVEISALQRPTVGYIPLTLLAGEK